MNTAQPYSPRKNSVAFNAIVAIANEERPITQAALELETATDAADLKASMSYAFKAGIVETHTDADGRTVWQLGHRADLLTGDIVLHLPAPKPQQLFEAARAPADECPADPPEAMVDLKPIADAHILAAGGEEEDLSDVTVIQVFDLKLREIGVLDSPRPLLFGVGSDGSVRISVDNTEDSILFEPQRAAELYAWFRRCAGLLAPLAGSGE